VRRKVWGPNNIVLPWVVRLHLWQNGHELDRCARVTVPLTDPSLGVLIECRCGKVWTY